TPVLRGPSETIWVIGHVAWTGATLIRAMEEARIHYPTARVLGAVLAATVDAAKRLRNVMFHQLAEGSSIELSFDASKEVGVENHNFILGGSKRDMPDVLLIGRALLSRARVDMARTYNSADDLVKDVFDDNAHAHS